ncbi:MAG: hypothetical protein V1889_01845 [archaeon]
MVNSILSDIGSKLRKKEKKIGCNITIDESLKKRIEEYKQKHKLTEFSPVINEMLWDWIRANDVYEQNQKLKGVSEKKT